MVPRIFALALIIQTLSAQTCDETQECYQSTLTSTAYCQGFRACQEAAMTSTAYCYSYYSCYDATMTGLSYIYGHYAAQYAKISTSSNIYIDGSYGAANSQIDGSIIYAYGFRALQSATIEPISNNLDLYLYGEYAGISANIKCYSGDDCDIYCRGTGCSSANFYCYTGATCTYDCNDNEPCPNLIEGTESGLTDAMIDKIFEENKKKIINDVPRAIPPTYSPKPRGFYLSFDNWQFGILCVLNALFIVLSVGLCLHNISKRKEDLNYSTKKVDFE